MDEFENGDPIDDAFRSPQEELEDSEPGVAPPCEDDGCGAPDADCEGPTASRSPLDLDALVDEVQDLIRRETGNPDFSFAPEQREAIRMVVSGEHRILVMTGGPGVGKSTVLNAILQAIFLAASRRGELRPQIALAAPTGKATKRITETTGMPAQTIHRLLECMPADARFNPNLDPGTVAAIHQVVEENRKQGIRCPFVFARNEFCRLEADFVAIDECSMIDIEQTKDLLSAVDPVRTRVLLIGDPDQLPPVGEGQPFLDLIASGEVPVVRLTWVYRQAKGNPILDAAYAVNRGDDIPWPDRKEDDRLVLFSAAKGDPGIEAIMRQIPDVIGWLNRRGVRNEDIQFLTARKAGSKLSAPAMNRVLQDLFNPGGQEVLRVENKKRPEETKVLRSGDRVMHVKNNYIKSVFNGEMGVITRAGYVQIGSKGAALPLPAGVDPIDLKTGALREGIAEGFYAAYEDGVGSREVAYYKGDAREIELAYAVTVHKSQGSEYRAVVLLCGSDGYTVAKRNWLYTGITRAKERVVILEQAGCISRAIKTVATGVRNTTLKERLKAI